MSNPNNQFAPFFMRYNPKTNAQGVDISTFSLSVRFSYKLNPQTPPLDFYRTFVFFANTTYTDEDGTQRLESLSPAENYTSPVKDLPTMVYFAIAKKRGDIARENNIQAQNITTLYPHNKEQLIWFEQAAEIQADNFARIATEKRTYARKLSNSAQDVLNKDVLYISLKPNHFSR